MIELVQITFNVPNSKMSGEQKRLLAEITRKKCAKWGEHKEPAGNEPDPGKKKD